MDHAAVIYSVASGRPRAGFKNAVIEIWWEVLFLKNQHCLPKKISTVHKKFGTVYQKMV
jgi:hypothetical protein